MDYRTNNCSKQQEVDKFLSLFVYIACYFLIYSIKTTKNMKRRKWPCLAALAGLNFQVQYSDSRGLLIGRVGDTLKCYGHDFHKES